MIYTIENEYVKLAFDSEQQCVSALENKITGDDYIKTKIPTPLCQLTLVAKARTTLITFQPCGDPIVTETSDHSFITIHYDAITDGMVELQTGITLEIGLDGNQTIWHLQIDHLACDMDIVETVFPYLRGIYLGKDWQDDVVIYPHHAGEKTLAPIREYTTPRFTSFWRAATHKENDYWWREVNYCGLASMMWIYYYDPGQGLYFASHDDDFLVTGVRLETGGPENPWMGFAFRKYHRIPGGQNWKSKPYVVALTGQDWHWGAQRYRSWIQQHIQAQPYPAYLDDEFSLTICYALKREGQVINPYSNLPDIFKEGKRAFRSRHMFIAAWNRGGFDTDYPEFQPDMDLGGPMELWRACQEITKQDGHVTFYINARIFDRSSLYFKTLGHKWVIKDEKGEANQEHYDWERYFSVCCPAHHEWQNYLMDVACWMVKSYGAKGIYLDQLGSAEPMPCYDGGHSHTDIGDFNHGYITILSELRKRLAKLDPEFYLMIENCGDIYSPYVWANLAWNGDPYDEFFNVYKYTFPEYALVHMVNPLENLPYEVREKRFYQDIQRATLLGAIFWLGREKNAMQSGKILDYLEKAVAFRAILAPLFKNGTFVDTEGIPFISDGIRASHWILPENRHLYLIGNIEEKSDLSLEITLPVGTDFSIKSENIDGVQEKILMDRQVNKMNIQVPAHTLSYILIRPK